MTVLLRIAAAGAWRAGSADRARSVLLTVCVAALSVLASGFIAVGNAHGRASERIALRGYAATTAEERADYLRSVAFDVAPDGSQIVIVTWKVLSDASIPRGFPNGAEMNTFYLSPALEHLYQTSAIIHERFSGAKTFETEFVGQADELIAYRLTSDSRGLDETLVDLPSDDAVGEITLPSASSTFAPTILLLVLPGTGLVWAAASIPSVRLRRRLELLHELGASRPLIRGIVIAQALIVVVPGAIIGLGIWSLTSRHLDHIPFTDLSVMKGDLTINTQQSAGLVVLIALVYSATLTMLSLARPRSRRRPSDLLSMVAVGTAALLIGPLVGGRNGFALLLAGVGAVVAGAPAMVECLYRYAGGRLARVGRWQTVLVGRQLTSAARGTARSQTAWLGLLIVLPLAVSWIATVRLTDARPSAQVSLVRAGSDFAAELRPLLEAELGVPAMQLAVEQLDLDDPHAPRLHLVAECDRLSETLDLTCSPDGRFARPDLDAFSRFEPEATPTVPAGFDLDDSLLLFLDAHGGAVENSLRTLAARTPGLSIGSEFSASQQESPLVSYVLGTLRAMTLVTATALALGIAGQSARTARARRKLIVLGASMRSIGGVVALETASIIGIASMTTVPLTSLSLWSMRRLEASTVVRPATLLWVGAMMVGVTLAASASAAVIATRASDSRHE